MNEELKAMIRFRKRRHEDGHWVIRLEIRRDGPSGELEIWEFTEAELGGMLTRNLSTWAILTPEFEPDASAPANTRPE